MAGQGGYGIQSAGGASLLAERLLRGEPLGPELEAEGVEGQHSPARYVGGAGAPGRPFEQPEGVDLGTSVPEVASAGWGMDCRRVDHGGGA